VIEAPEYEKLKQIAESAGDLCGWDFSRVRDERGPVPWEFVDVARRTLSATDGVLDIGTGGGERFLSLAPHFRRGTGTDISPGMIRQAQKNAEAQGVDTIEWLMADGHRLAFADGQFDVVLNRHCRVDPAETVRVLRHGGTFVTQQVARRNTRNILAAFGWTPESFGEGWWQPVEGLAAEFQHLGCRVVAQGEYDVRYWFLDVASLLFWLKAVPLPDALDLEVHWRGVRRIIEEYGTERGIETNEHRELLIVEKL
jgi:SAM-dependent methyltransferase